MATTSKPSATSRRAEPQAAPRWRRPLGWSALRPVAVLVHLLAFWGTVAVLPAAAAPVQGWALLYAAGLAWLWLAGRVPDLRAAGMAPSAVFVYALLLAAIFLGADGALDALRGSVKPRSALPVFVHGLALHWVLAPGIASVALAAWIERRCTR